MKWYLDERFPPSDNPIDVGDKLLFFGSCFSHQIALKARFSGLNASEFPFGTIFHPIPMARLLNDIISNQQTPRILERDGLFYSWDCSTKFSRTTKWQAEKDFIQQQTELLESLKRSKFLFITFGTAMAYHKIDNDLVVANCHKLPAINFRKEKTDFTYLVSVYKHLIDQLLVLNPELKVVFTVSPVRHSKEGIIENNRSKARLLLLCEELQNTPNVSYFPAYEILIDQLRDYRFYSSDLVHPNELAIDYIWSIFQDHYLRQETKIKLNQIVGFRQFFAHKSSNEESQQSLLIKSKKEKELREFLLKNPKIIW